ncbi:hypothetical protein KSF_010530 [Reticulibacter mediterranei]|uniref:Uncharacterized protein n=1 Tax=Reticulibacter mediterranei TaxID=2778369 RepID=A0A8J3IHT0_9CHLR|nr:hypothetical protein [Reticulibacter mediterranei]GHO91005.1 hypothetical protein KSF_010530 [Reticulibacter mediterranei]
MEDSEMIMLILLATQPPDFWHDPFNQFIINIIVAVVFSGVLTSVVAIWIFRRQQQKKEISYEIISDASVISVKKNVESRVEIRLDGNPVKEVTLAVIKVSNTGNTAVKKDDYDKPLQFLFMGRTVISSEVTETEPEDLIDQSDYKSFFLQPTPTQDFIEFPKITLNRKHTVTFSVLLNGARNEISTKGMIIDGDIVQFKSIMKQRRNLMISGVMYSITFFMWSFIIQGLKQIIPDDPSNPLILFIKLIVVTIITLILLILMIIWLIKSFKTFFMINK